MIKIATLSLAAIILAGCIAVPYDNPPPPQQVERPTPRRGAAGDRDRDGIPNRVDRDRDGDGVPNRYDRRPNNPNRS